MHTKCRRVSQLLCRLERHSALHSVCRVFVNSVYVHVLCLRRWFAHYTYDIYGQYRTLKERAIFSYYQGQFLGIPCELCATCYGVCASLFRDVSRYNSRKMIWRFW